nr:uncharacterized protein K02A2.6-like [Parasteatoda tepidariorum]
MTSAPAYHITPPESFPFSIPSEWPKWKQRFLRFRTASGLITKTDEEQVDALIYVMGDKAEDIFLSLSISEEDKKKFQEVLNSFDTHFVVKRNIIFERAQFNRRIQKEGESVNDFITALYALADKCEYGNLHDELLRDRIVVGIKDQTLSEKLQLDSELTLQTAIDKVRLSESVKKQQSLLVENSTVNAISQKKKYNKTTNADKSNFHDSKSKYQDSKTNYQRKNCKWCGKQPHEKRNCPAKDSNCRKCKKRGHWDNVCLSTIKRVNELCDAGFVGLVGSTQNTDEWVVPVKILGKCIQFKIDSGADYSVIPSSIASTVLKHAELKSTDKVIFGPDKTPLKLMGKLLENVEYNGKKCLEEIYVIEGLQTCLLGKPAIKFFGLGPNIQSQSVLNITSFNPFHEFPSLFQGLGLLKGSYHVELNSDVKPYALTSPRRIPIPLLEKTKLEIQRMQELNVIQKVEKPTDWCSPAVVVRKKDGSVRICVDLTTLNRSIKREWHPLPTTEYNLSLLAGAKIFSKLDANSGFWQIPLDEESSYLTTFITPFGRFRFLRLPFGISSAPEHFQRRMSQALEGLPGIICHMDDILVWGSNQKEHDERLTSTLIRLKETGITLNKQKCCFSVKSIKYLGHVIDDSGIHPDQDKVKAIQNFRSPTNKTELKQLLGMANYLARFIPRFSDIMAPLISMLSTKNKFVWNSPQETALKKLKDMLLSEPILTIYDPNKQSIVTADASSYGLGATLCQKHDSTIKVVAYASRTLTPTEQRYAQIEKEALALTWACEKFSNYLMGTKFLLETDHKPLVPILTRKSLDDLTPRLQRLKMRLMRYSFDVFHTPGKNLCVADALSRAPHQQETPNLELEEEVEAFINQVLESVPMSSERLSQIKLEQETDSTCNMLINYASQGWPEKNQIVPSCLPFWPLRYEISIQNGLLMRGNRIIVPNRLRQEILGKIHEGHMGINKCRALANSAVYWPGISKQIEELVRDCPSCIQEAKNCSEPLKPTSFPQRPWEIVAMDLFKLHAEWYLLVTDFYSRYPEVAKLDSLTSKEVILHCKSIFARHGIPNVVRSDNGPQFEVTRTAEFQNFAKVYGFKHITSSPRYPQSNGFVEAAVKIIKLRFKKSKDPYLALLSYRTTPLKNGYSPAELLMGRRLQSTLPLAISLLQPKLIEKEILEEKEEKRIERQKKDYDRRHNAHELKPIHPGDKIWITDRKAVGTVQRKAESPRSYFVKEGKQVLRRNRKHLIPGSKLQIPPLNDDLEEALSERDNRWSLPEITDPDPTVLTQKKDVCIFKNCCDSLWKNCESSQ